MARYGSRRWLKKQHGRAREDARASYHRTQGRSDRIWLMVPGWIAAKQQAFDAMLYALGHSVGAFLFKSDPFRTTTLGKALEGGGDG